MFVSPNPVAQCAGVVFQSSFKPDSKFLDTPLANSSKCQYTRCHGGSAGGKMDGVEICHDCKKNGWFNMAVTVGWSLARD